MKFIAMTEPNSPQESRPDDMTGKGHDRQGNDKAPGEETASDMNDAVNITQRGKNKVDGDPTQPSDRARNQQ